MKFLPVIFIVIGSSWGNIITNDMHKAMETVMHKYNELGIKLHSPAHRPSSPEHTGCECVGYNCGCCAYLDVPDLHIDDEGCVNVTYLPEQYGISFTFSLNGKVFYNATVSAKNPPPICFGIPYLEKEASICIEFYDIDYSKAHFGGCIKLQFRLVYVLKQDIDLGCFNIPLSMKHWLMLRDKGLWEDVKGLGEEMKGVAEDVKGVVEEMKVRRELKLGQKWMKKELMQNKEKIEKIMRGTARVNMV